MYCASRRRRLSAWPKYDNTSLLVRRSGVRGVFICAYDTHARSFPIGVIERFDSREAQPLPLNLDARAVSQSGPQCETPLRE